MKRILTLLRHYLPNENAGPVHSIATMARLLGDEYEFSVITGGQPGVPHGRWVRIQGGRAFYCEPSMQKTSALRRLIQSTPHDVLYLNSVFDPVFAIRPLVLRRLRLLPARPTVIAPRGMFSPGALALKTYKKQAYLAFAGAAGLHNGVTWHAASEREKHDIQQQASEDVTIQVAPNGPTNEVLLGETVTPDRKKEGRLRVLFMSRIAPEKNLDGALDLLRKVQGVVTFDIYGPISDNAYWKACRRRMEQLPQNVRAQYRGAIPHDEVVATMATYDLFFLPTHGENFGHVILEALAAGCPVLISDQTPWIALQAKKAGWDVSLSAPDRFVRIIERCIQVPADEYRHWRAGAQSLARQSVDLEATAEASRKLFDSAMNLHAS